MNGVFNARLLIVKILVSFAAVCFVAIGAESGPADDHGDPSRQQEEVGLFMADDVDSAEWPSETDLVNPLSLGAYLKSVSSGTEGVEAIRAGMPRWLPTGVLFGHSRIINSLDLSPDGTLALTGSEGGSVRLWRIDQHGEEISELATLFSGQERVFCVAFSPDGRLALTGANDRRLRLWELSQTGESMSEVASWDMSESVSSVGFSPDGTLVLTGGFEGQLKLWKFDEKSFDLEEIALMEDLDAGGSFSSVAFSSDSSLASASLLGGETTKIWRITDSRDGVEEIAELRGHSDWVQYVSFSPNGRLLLTASLDGTVGVWAIEEGDFEVRRVATLSGHSRGAFSAKFSPDGTKVIVTSGRWIGTLWELINDDGSVDPRVTRTFDGLWIWTGAIAFSPDGRFILAGSWDQTAKLWRLSDAPHYPPSDRSNWDVTIPAPAEEPDVTVSAEWKMESSTLVGESFEVHVAASNEGPTALHNLVAALRVNDDLVLPVWVGTIEGGQSVGTTVTVPVSSDMASQETTLSLLFRDMHDRAPSPLRWSGRLPVQPALRSSVSWSDDNDGRPNPGERGTLHFEVQNLTSLPIRSVNIQAREDAPHPDLVFNDPEPTLILDTPIRLTVDRIDASSTLEFSASVTLAEIWDPAESGILLSVDDARRGITLLSEQLTTPAE
mgnify:CR=1 FL=1